MLRPCYQVCTDYLLPADLIYTFDFNYQQPHYSHQLCWLSRTCVRATDRPIELVFTRLKSLVDILTLGYSFFSHSHVARSEAQLT